MPSPIYQALGGRQQPQINPAEYRQRIDAEIRSFQQQRRNPTAELEQLLQSGKIPAEKLAFARQLGRAVASRLYGGRL